MCLGIRSQFSSTLECSETTCWSGICLVLELILNKYIHSSLTLSTSFWWPITSLSSETQSWISNWRRFSGNSQPKRIVSNGLASIQSFKGKSIGFTIQNLFIKIKMSRLTSKMLKRSWRKSRKHSLMHSINLPWSTIIKTNMTSTTCLPTMLISNFKLFGLMNWSKRRSKRSRKTAFTSD